MPTRILRDGILDSDTINLLSETAELFYRRLMSLVDDFGRYEARPAVLRTKLFGLQLDRWPEDRILAALLECRGARLYAGTAREVSLVTIYEFNGRSYLQINNFNQRIRSNPSKYPDPPSDGSGAPQSTAERREAPQGAAERGEERRTAANGGAGPPTRARTRTETYAEADANANARTEARADGRREGPVPIRPSNGTSLAASNPAAIAFREVWQRWPRRSGETSAARDWISVVTPDNLPDVLACVERYLASDEVARGYVRNLGSTPEREGWIVTCARDRWHSDWPSAQNPQGREPTHAEVRRAQVVEGLQALERIRRG